MKKIISLVLSLAMFLCVFAVAAPSASAGNVDYPWMYLKNQNDMFYAGDYISLKFDVFREYNDEIYYVEIYDPSGNLVASCDRTFSKYNSSIIDYTVNWDTSGYTAGTYKVHTYSKFYSLYRWNLSPNVDNYYITLRDPATRPVVGWNHDGIGWWFLKDNGNACSDEWIFDKGIWYYFNSSSYMVTGWKSVGGNWYYFNGDGAMQTGWIFDGFSWYFLDSNGIMKTGWLHDGTAWYYLHTSGAMLTGWQYIEGNWYFLNNSGVMQTGWIFDGISWYYLNSSGVMQTGWIYVDGTWYYLYDSGAMATNVYLSGGYINSSGAWIAQ